DDATHDAEPLPPWAPTAPTRKWLSVRLAAEVLVLAIALSLGAYVYLQSSPEAAPRVADSAASQVSDTAQPTPPAEDRVEASIFSQVFGGETSSAAGDSQLTQGLTVTWRLLLASLLATLLAFRPHRYLPALQRNPNVAQTQILLAVVASALMMIVGDNAARAFGIFAAVSLVRFRTNIRDPKEVTVLLISLAIGLATGVGRWELAVILSVFALATLWVLEYFESRQVVRSMQLKVKTHNITETDNVLREVFGRNNLSAEVREVDREDEKHPIGRIVYYVTVGPRVSTDQLSEEIFSADPHNVDTVEWHQKKSVSYAYR
ncbi:MAG TPA: DUF4956 domain-containing protein, partial [Blastocatellia bacterium]|nr:DUF4956 domain-containing protein [Blastocatellia bacterium]